MDFRVLQMDQGRLTAATEGVMTYFQLSGLMGACGLDDDADFYALRGVYVGMPKLAQAANIDAMISVWNSQSWPPAH